jgi:hypothetical protein
MKKVTGMALLALLAGCGGGNYQPAIGGELHQKCGETRSQVCTREYAPVCAFVGKGQRREYSNACTACSDEAVSGYIPGPCPEE